MKINGKWYFNETVSLGGIAEDVKFTSNSTAFISISNYDEELLYFLDNTEGDNEVVYNLSNGWTNETYRTIDFGAAYQEVSDELYTWLTANATKLNHVVPMERPKGMKLLCKGQKMAEDYEIVPTFSTLPESVDVEIMIGTQYGTTYIFYTSVSDSGEIESIQTDNDNAETYSVDVGGTKINIKAVKNSLVTVIVVDGGGVSVVTNNGDIIRKFGGDIDGQYIGVQGTFIVSGKCGIFAGV